MSRRHYVDNAPTTTLTGTITSAATSFAVTSLVGFPTSTPWTATIDLGTASAEQVLVNTVVGMTLTVTRNDNGQGAFSHTVGAAFNHTADARDFDEANAHINATTNVHGITGTFADTTSAQTLTNKTLSGGTAQFNAVAGTPGVSIATDAGTTVGVQVKNSSGTVVAKILGDGSLTATTSTLGAVTAASVAVTGNETVGGTLGVTGTSTLAAVNAQATSATTLASSAAATLNSAVVTNSLTVGTTAAVTGNASVGGSLSVTGNTTIAGAATVTGAITVAALTGTTATLSGLVTANAGVTTTTLTAGGAATVASLTSTGAVTAAGVDLGAGQAPVSTSTVLTIGSTAVNMTGTAATVRTLCNGKMIYLSLTVTTTNALTASAGDVSPDVLIFTVNTAYKPAEIVIGAFSALAGGQCLLNTDGTIKVSAASDTISAGSTIRATFAYMLP